MKTVTFSTTALKALRRHASRADLIRAKIEQYATEPAAMANNVKALQGSDLIRLRVGDFRVIFREDATTILVVDVGPRSGIYE